jgi:hypothetical protein
MSDATENTVQAERRALAHRHGMGQRRGLSFRRSPVAMISAAVTALLILIGGLRAADRAA